MIRLIIAIIFVVVFLVISLPIQLVLWLLRFKWPTAPDKVSYALVCWCFRVVLWFSGVKLTVIGKENIDPGEACLYIGNHRGLFDILVTYIMVRRPCGFLSKDTFAKVPGLNIWMNLMHCVFIDRSDIKEGLKKILVCIDMIKNGISVFIFPEGTRSREKDKFGEFHEGSFKVATKTNCPIVPVVINNTSAVFDDQAPFIKSAHVVVEFLPSFRPGDLEGDDKKRIGAYTQKIIEKKYFENKELV